jgi:putative transposase
MLRLKAYRLRLQPTPAQAHDLGNWGHALRFLWNWMLAQRKDTYEASEGRAKVGYNDQAGQLPAMKEVFPWLGLLPSQLLQQTLMDLDRSYVNFFEGRAKYPTFKKRGRGDPGLRWPQGVEVNGRCIWLPKLGWVKARFSRKVTGTIKSASVKFDGLHWNASNLVEERVEIPSKHEGPDLGVDAGVVESLAFSDGRRFRLPVATPGEERRLILLSRRASRCKAGSRRHGRARRKLLVFKRKIINRVNDARHKQTSILAKNHGRIFGEGLALVSLTRAVRGTVETPGRNVAIKSALNRAILEQGHAEAFRQLGYKLGWLGGELHRVPAAFTSQRCPECGHTCSENRPSRDRFQCVACGHSGHADNVAARNILAAGQAASARGGSREPVKREPTRSRRFLRRSVGIPAL